MKSRLKALTRICCGNVRSTQHCPDCGSDLGSDGHRQAVVYLRIPAALHAAIAQKADAQLLSVNAFCAEAIARAVLREPANAGVIDRELATP